MCNNQLLYVLIFLAWFMEARTQNVATERIYTQVERMPQCPECTSSTDNMYKTDLCTRNALQSWWLANMAYPVEALNDKIEGTVFFQVVIDTFGLICEVRLQQSPHTILDEEAKRLMELYESARIAWSPGTQKGKKAKVLMDLTVEFSLKMWKEELERRSRLAESMRQDSLLKTQPPIDSTRKVNKK